MTTTSQAGGVDKIVLPIGKTSIMELLLDRSDREYVLKVLEHQWPYMALLVHTALAKLDAA